MRISIIAAVARSGAIGLNNRLLCHLPNDLKHFRKRTMGRHVVMGRKTYESLPSVLTGRSLIVVTRQVDYGARGVCIASTIDAAFDIARSRQETEVFVAGGAQIYTQTLHKAHALYITYIEACLQGDTFFPSISSQDWAVTAHQTHAPDARHPYPYTFVDLLRTKHRTFQKSTG